MAVGQAEDHLRARPIGVVDQALQTAACRTGRTARGLWSAVRVVVVEAAVLLDDGDPDAEGARGEHRQKVRGRVVPATLRVGVTAPQELGDREPRAGVRAQVGGVRDEAEGVELTAGGGVVAQVQARVVEVTRTEGVGVVGGHEGQQVDVGRVRQPGGEPAAQGGDGVGAGGVDADVGEQVRVGAVQALEEGVEERVAVSRHVDQDVGLLSG